MITTERNALRDVFRAREAIIEEQREQEREQRRLEEILMERSRRLSYYRAAARDHMRQAESLLGEARQKIAEARALEDRARMLEEEANRYNLVLFDYCVYLRLLFLDWRVKKTEISAHFTVLMS